MDDKPVLTRWHWRAMATGRPGLPATHFEFHFEDLHTPADPEARLGAEGHHLLLQWHDPDYASDPDRQFKREFFITEQFRKFEVRAAFWTIPVSGNLSVRIGLAQPDARLGDDMKEPQVLRVAFQCDGQEFIVGPINPARPGLSKVFQAEEAMR